MQALGMADDLLDERVYGDIQRFARLVTAIEDLLSQTVAGIAKLGRQVVAAQVELRPARSRWRS